MKDDPDAKMVAAACNGDKAAGERLLQGIQTRVYQFILRQAASTQDAEDLTQETLLEVYRNLQHFQGSSRFSTWVLGIAQNRVRNYHNRSATFRFPTTDTEVLETLPEPRAGPEESYLISSRIQALQRGFADYLTPDLREALTLVSLEGMGYEDAAEILNLPVGTVKTRVFRARKMLKNGLQAAGQLTLFKENS